MKPKPTITRYYLNTKSGQRAKLEGPRLAVNAHERYWRKKKIVAVRIPAHTFRKDQPKVLFSVSADYYPMRQRYGKRLFKMVDGGLTLSVAFYTP